MVIEFESLKENKKEQEEFIRKGFERIKEYYTLPSDKRGKETKLSLPPLSIPPHEMLLKRAAKIIELGLNSNRELNELYRDFDRFDYILIGIGTEILLKAILLKEEPNFIINHKKFNDHKTPNFHECKNKLINILRCKLSSTHLERVEDVLELIQIKRNNLAHLSFHRMSDYREDYQAANVLRFLFLYFFKVESSRIVQILDKVKEKAKVTSGIDYEPVEFEGYI